MSSKTVFGVFVLFIILLGMSCGVVSDDEENKQKGDLATTLLLAYAATPKTNGLFNITLLDNGGNLFKGEVGSVLTLGIPLNVNVNLSASVFQAIPDTSSLEWEFSPALETPLATQVDGKVLRFIGLSPANVLPEEKTHSISATLNYPGGIINGNPKVTKQVKILYNTNQYLTDRKCTYVGFAGGCSSSTGYTCNESPSCSNQSTCSNLSDCLFR
ncbi:hypothetical protein P3G55_04655 [Leptospira sp. 96542]|nr:hypothetical protein [Leptospira sp. 96542]